MRIESVNSRKEELKECKGVIYNFKEINCANQYGTSMWNIEYDSNETSKSFHFLLPSETCCYQNNS